MDYETNALPTEPTQQVAGSGHPDQNLIVLTPTPCTASVAEWLRRQTQVLVLFEGVSSNLTGCIGCHFFWSLHLPLYRGWAGRRVSSSRGCVRNVTITGRIAQSVERWSNKPLVMGSSPIVTRFFCSSLCGELHVAFVAERLRRYVQVVVNFVGVGSSPTECNMFFFGTISVWCGCSPHLSPPSPLCAEPSMPGWQGHGPLGLRTTALGGVRDHQKKCHLPGPFH